MILGQQGSGKGTQAQLLGENFNMEHIDMGRSLREIAQSETPLGKEVYEIQNIKKTLVSSKILRELLDIKLKSIHPKKGIVFDGVPRTIDQVEYLEDALERVGRKVDYVFFISIPREESIRRVSKRRICNQCQSILLKGKEIKNDTEPCPNCGGQTAQREDDTPEGIEKRLEVFAQETVPVLEHYRREGVLIEIDGTKPVEEVFQRIKDSIKNHND